MVLECNISVSIYGLKKKKGLTVLVALWILDPWRWDR